DRVADRDRGMRVGAGIDDDACRLLRASLVNRVHDLALVVRLAEFDRELVARGRLATKLLHIRERGAPIGLGLARAEQIEVGAVEDVDSVRHGGSGAAGYPLVFRDHALWGPWAQRGSRGAQGSFPRPALSAMNSAGPALGSGRSLCHDAPRRRSAGRLAAARGVDLFLQRIEADRADYDVGAHHVARRAVEA